MPVSSIVIDDFLEDPEAFRNVALGLSYPVREGEAFPGRNSVEQLNLSGLDQEISAIVREPLRAPHPPQSHGRCRVTLARDSTKPAKIHIDPSYWSGVLYLSRPEDCRGGTEFYRHLPTGTDGAPTDPAKLRELGFTSYEALNQQILQKDVHDRSKWELTSTVPMRFNRLVLLRGWLWHTSGNGFGDTIENGRLVYLMFFRPAR